MRRALIAILGFVAFTATPVLAADMAVKAPPAPPPPALSWTGFYVGGTLGGGWGNSFQSFFDPVASAFGTTGNYSTRGPLGGFTAGYNWQVMPYGV